MFGPRQSEVFKFGMRKCGVKEFVGPSKDGQLRS